MIRAIFILIALAAATAAHADPWFGTTQNDVNNFNHGPTNSGAYGNFHDNYQSPQNDGRYRQYETERYNRQQYNSNY